MSVSDDQIAHALELFDGVGPLTTRKMMGGLCIYSDGTIFCIIHADHGIMIKGKGDFIAELEDLGCTRWTYTRDRGDKAGGPTGMPYWTLPDSALDDPAEATALARRALAHL